MKTLKWLKVILMMQTKVKMSLMRILMVLFLLVFLGCRYTDILNNLKLPEMAKLAEMG